MHLQAVRDPVVHVHVHSCTFVHSYRSLLIFNLFKVVVGALNCMTAGVCAWFLE